MAKVFCVLSGKGGVGKSTFCVNIGKALSKTKKVLLIDGDIAFRSLDILLGLDSMTVFDWTDVIFDRCQKEKACLFASENLHLLSSPLSLPKSFSKSDFDRLISEYNEMYDYIFIDSPAGMGEYAEIYAKVSDGIIVIATPDDISLRAACTVSEKLIDLGIDENKMRLVLNKTNYRQMRSGKQRNLDTAIDKTYLRLLGVVPNDNSLVFTGENGIYSVSKRVNEAFSNISGRILGKDIKLYY